MNAPHTPPSAVADPLVIAGRAYRSRLLVGTGKYKDFARDARGDRRLAAPRSSPSRSAAPTSARTRTQPSLLDALPPSEFTYLPNTAGCYTADDAVRTLRLARELLDGHTLVKLEVLGDPQTLFPNVRETLEGRGDAGARRLPGDGLHAPTIRSSRASSRRSAASRSCRSPR